MLNSVANTFTVSRYNTFTAYNINRIESQEKLTHSDKKIINMVPI